MLQLKWLIFSTDKPNVVDYGTPAATFPSAAVTLSLEVLACRHSRVGKRRSTTSVSGFAEARTLKSVSSHWTTELVGSVMQPGSGNHRTLGYNACMQLELQAQHHSTGDRVLMDAVGGWAGSCCD